MARRRRRRKKNISFRGSKSINKFIKNIPVVDDAKASNLESILNSYRKRNKNKMDSIIKAKKDILVKYGWEEVKPEFNFEYLLEIGVDKVAKEFGFYISKLTKEVSNNPLGLFSEDAEEDRNNFLEAVCPNVTVPPLPINTPLISAQWPISEDYTSSESAFEELTYRTMILLVTKVLGTPDKAYQYQEGKFVFIHKDVNKLDFNDLVLVADSLFIWEENKVTLLIKPTTLWTDNGQTSALDWTLYSNNLRKLSSKALINTGLELNPKTYQLGELDPEFVLGDFPDYIQNHTADLIRKMYKENQGYPERYNVLVTGPPGYGYC